jgi:hypothetical protein
VLETIGDVLIKFLTVLSIYWNAEDKNNVSRFSTDLSRRVSNRRFKAKGLAAELQYYFQVKNLRLVNWIPPYYDRFDVNHKAKSIMNKLVQEKNLAD